MLTKEKLAELLKLAAERHHEFELESGEKDADWPTWYADFILRQLNPKSEEQIENEFVMEAYRAADTFQVDIIDVYNDGTGDSIFEDDGFLHVTVGKKRVSFDVSENQTLSVYRQNENTKKILKALGKKVVPNALA